MTRNYTRKMRGGDVNIEEVKSTIVQLKDDVLRITDDIETLGKNLELNGVPEVLNKEITNESAENKLQDKAKQVVNEFNQELVDYAKIMKSIIENGTPIKKKDKDFLIENMNTHKTLFENVGITEELLNNVQIDEEVANKSAESVNANEIAESVNNVQIVDNEDKKDEQKVNVDKFPIKFKNFNFTIGDLKQLINHKKQNNERVEKYNAAKLGFYEIYNKKKNDSKEELIKKFENFLNNNLNIFGDFKYTDNEKNKTNGWTFGGRKTKKNQKKSRKSRRHNKSRK